MMSEIKLLESLIRFTGHRQALSNAHFHQIHSRRKMQAIDNKGSLERCVPSSDAGVPNQNAPCVQFHDWKTLRNARFSDQQVRSGGPAPCGGAGMELNQTSPEFGDYTRCYHYRRQSRIKPAQARDDLRKFDVWYLLTCLRRQSLPAMLRVIAPMMSVLHMGDFYRSQ